MALRLRGEIDGEMQHIVLPIGELVAGSGRDCDVVFDARGVSRRHARLEVMPDAVRVRDLESKNGTHLDGRRLPPGMDAEARAGSRLRFGPLELELEKVEEEDARLGLELDTSSIFDPSLGALRADASTWWTRDGGAVGRRHLRAFEAVVERLIGLPEPDLDGALADLAAACESSGAALIEWSEEGARVGDEKPLVIAAAGELGELPSLEDFPGSAEQPQRRLRRPGLAAASWSEAGTGGSIGLVLWGEGVGGGSEELLSSLLRLLRRFRPAARSAAAGSAAAEPSPAESDEAAGGLQLPDSVVRGRSPAMTALYQQMEILLQGDVPALLLGETGVGKEHLARALHDSSPRSGGPFVAINCAAIPEQLLEAEMFGIGKGVATGVSPRRGRFAEASGGTLFLDEVGEMPPELQAKLLRVLQERVVHPLGRAPESVDVRIVAATNADLRRLAADGGFRIDLYYRLAGYELCVPPLRERRDDIAQLAGHFLRRFCRETRKPVRGITVKALRLLTDYAWPGNVRELEHEMRRLVYSCPRGRAIDAERLSEPIRRPLPGTGAGDLAVELDERGLDAQLQDLEKRLLVRALERTAGNQSRAARLLEISRNGLAKRLKRLGLDAADFQ